MLFLIFFLFIVNFHYGNLKQTHLATKLASRLPWSHTLLRFGHRPGRPKAMSIVDMRILRMIKKKNCLANKKKIRWSSFTTFSTFTFSKSKGTRRFTPRFRSRSLSLLQPKCFRDRVILVLVFKINESFPNCTRINIKNRKYDSTVQYISMPLIPSRSNNLYGYCCKEQETSIQHHDKLSKTSEPLPRTVAPCGCFHACHGSRLPRRVSSATLQVGSRGGATWMGIAESCCHAVFGDSVMSVPDIVLCYGLSDVLVC